MCTQFEFKCKHLYSYLYHTEIEMEKYAMSFAYTKLDSNVYKPFQFLSKCMIGLSCLERVAEATHIYTYTYIYI